MQEFKTYHPLIHLLYFVSIIGFTMYFMHPLCLLISLAGSLAAAGMYSGGKALKAHLGYLVPILLLTACINPAFNHRGVTILTHFPGGNPLTLESVLYGVASASMLASVILWFSSCSRMMTSDRIQYLFGKKVPALSLIFSMTLRFVPRFTMQLKTVANAQRCLGQNRADKTVIGRIRHGLGLLSAMATWSLENSVETADSMKSRGYGLPGRTAFSIYAFERRDGIALCILLLLSVLTLIGGILGGMSFSYYPVMESAHISVFSVLAFVCYFLLCMLPVIIELWEVRRWKAISSSM